MKDAAISSTQVASKKLEKSRKQILFFSFILIFSFILKSYFHLPGWATNTFYMLKSILSPARLPSPLVLLKTSTRSQTMEHSLGISDSSTPASPVAHFFAMFHKFCFSISSPAPQVRPLEPLSQTTVNAPNWPLYPSTSALNPWPGKVPQYSPAPTASGLSVLIPGSRLHLDSQNKMENRFFPRASKRNSGLPTPWFTQWEPCQTSNLWNCMVINLCCVNPQSLW